MRIAALWFGCALSAAGCDRVFGLDDRVPDAAVDSTPDMPVDVPAECMLPRIIDDTFENQDLATPDGMSVGSGFMEVTNEVNNGSSLERVGGYLELRTANQTMTAVPTQGAVDLAGFVFDPAGMTVRIEVTAADTPIWNGIVLALQSRPNSLDSVGPSLVVRVRGSTTHAFTVDVGDQNTYAESLDMQPYDEAALADGFVITWWLDGTHWRYQAEGLRTDDSVIVAEGDFPPEYLPSVKLASTAHLGIHIQGTTNDASQRILRVGRLTLWNGLCP